MIDLGQKGNSVFIVALVFLTVFFFIVRSLQYYMILSW